VLALFLKNLVYATETVGEIEMDLKSVSGDWIGVETFSTPQKYFQFEDGDGFTLGYEQPLLVQVLEVIVNPSTQSTEACLLAEDLVQLDIATLPTSIYLNSEFTIDASATDLSKLF
jgi:hypothetical protein